MKHQIFVSSTYEDLKEARDSVIKAILEMGHIPVGMEMFSAADEEQWAVIKRQIDDSDYYVVIAAHRYGSLDGDISFTEKEYNYAVQSKVPTLGFILEDRAEWPVIYVEQDTKAKESLARFKMKIREKPVGFWKTSEELNAKVSIALMKIFITTPRPGWSRGVASIGPEVTNELSRLSIENSQLRETLDRMNSEADTEKKQREEISSILVVLETNEVNFSVRFLGEEEWTSGPRIALYKIFTIVAPYMVAECGAKRMSRLLAVVYSRSVRQEGGKVSKEWPVARNNIFTYLSYLKALNLIEASPGRQTKPDDDVYWSLTKIGEKVHGVVLLRELSMGDDQSMPTNPRNQLDQ